MASVGGDLAGDDRDDFGAGAGGAAHARVGSGKSQSNGGGLLQKLSGPFRLRVLGSHSAKIFLAGTSELPGTCVHRPEEGSSRVAALGRAVRARRFPDFLLTHSKWRR